MTSKKSIRRALQSMIQNHSMHLLMPFQIKTALIDECPSAELEIELLLIACRSDIISEMKRLRHSMPPAHLLSKMTRWLVREANIGEADARWVIDSWAMAFGIIAFAEDDLTPANNELIP